MHMVEIWTCDHAGCGAQTREPGADGWTIRGIGIYCPAHKIVDAKDVLAEILYGHLVYLDANGTLPVLPEVKAKLLAGAILTELPNWGLAIH